MPVKRRVVKTRKELCQGERLFLAGVDWPLESGEYEDSAPGKFLNSMVHCWLTSPWRDDNPTGGPTARELWAEYGEQALAEWIAQHPGTRPEPWWRFSAPEPLSEGEDQANYLRRHGLLTPAEVQALGGSR